ncbi:MAG: site-specific DNA-methyltransferase [Promethearchaeota archaeon]
MTDIERRQLVWRGKFESKRNLDQVKNTLVFEIMETINKFESAEAWNNKLILSENIPALQSLLREFSGKINVIYIDPPFASGLTFKTNAQRNHNKSKKVVISSDTENLGFKDTWGEGGLDVYLTFMYERLILMRDLLANTGSLFVHLDWHAVHYVKIILDEIFGYENFRADIIWQRTPGHHLSSTMDVMTDIILWYSKSPDFIYHQQYQSLSEEEKRDKFPYLEEETGRSFTHEKLEQSANAYSIGEKRLIDGREITTNIGWRWTQETFDKRIAENPHLIFWTSKGRPRYKRYSDEYPGRKIGNLWIDIPALASNDKERLGYPTQKPEVLLERIIRMTTREGDIVADFFCGSGTTVVVAEKLNRRWIGVDSLKYAINLTKQRLINIRKSKSLSQDGKPYDKEANSFEILKLA